MLGCELKLEEDDKEAAASGREELWRGSWLHIQRWDDKEQLVGWIDGLGRTKNEGDGCLREDLDLGRSRGGRRDQVELVRRRNETREEF